MQIFHTLPVRKNYGHFIHSKGCVGCRQGFKKKNSYIHTREGGLHTFHTSLRKCRWYGRRQVHIYSIPLSSLVSLSLCYLFSFILELIIRRWIQFNSPIHIFMFFFVRRLSGQLMSGIPSSVWKGHYIVVFEILFFFFFFLGRRLPIVSAMDA